MKIALVPFLLLLVTACSKKDNTWASDNSANYTIEGQLHSTKTKLPLGNVGVSLSQMVDTQE